MSGFRSRIALGFGLGFALLLILGALAFVASRRNLAGSRETARSYEFLQQVDRSFALALDAQRAARGFVISGDESFLDAHGVADRELPAVLGALDTLTPARNAGSVAELRTLVSAALLFADSVVAVRRQEGRSQAEALVAGGRGRELIESLRRSVVQIRGTEERTLADLGRSVERDARSAAVLIPLVVLVGFFLALGGGLLLVRYIGRLQAAEHRIAALAADLERRVGELSAANAELEIFANGISHDVRAPLRALSGYASALREDYGDQLDELGREYCERLSASARRLDRLTQDLVRLGTLGRAELRLEPVPVRAAVQEALATLDPEIQTSGARIAVELEADPVVEAERGTLVSALGNVLSNALKYVPPGVQPRIRVWAEQSGPEVLRLWVEDNGIGIAPEDRERIFDVFTRLHTGTHYAGSGIGLALVRKSVELMGGTVGVRSELGRGSRFWISLRASRDAADRSPADHSRADRPRPDRTRHPVA